MTMTPRFNPVTRTSASDLDSILLDLRRGRGVSCWRVLADCRDYLKIVIRQGNWTRSSDCPRSSDLVQRTIVDAWRKFSGFRGGNDRQLRDWLRAIRIDGVRTDRRNANPIDPDTSRRIDVAIAALGERDRIVVRLRI